MTFDDVIKGIESRLPGWVWSVSCYDGLPRAFVFPDTANPVMGGTFEAIWPDLVDPADVGFSLKDWTGSAEEALLTCAAVCTARLFGKYSPGDAANHAKMSELCEDFLARAPAAIDQQILSLAGLKKHIPPQVNFVAPAMAHVAREIDIFEAFMADDGARAVADNAFSELLAGQPGLRPVSSLHDALAIAHDLHPGCNWRIGRCSVTDDALIETGDVELDISTVPPGYPAAALCEVLARLSGTVPGCGLEDGPSTQFHEILDRVLNLGLKSNVDQDTYRPGCS